jgi:LytS/YehU family sensor histidine kinase
VPLEKEIDMLKKYVELEKLRYGNRLDISFSCSGNVRQLKIAPLVLLPFVENSFKHGVSEQLDQCWINLHMHATGNTFTFNLSNSRSNEAATEAPGGIGLQNIKKRLELIYPGNYSMTINEAPEIYSVKLEVQLSTMSQVIIKQVPAAVLTQPIPAIV